MGCQAVLSLHLNAPGRGGATLIAPCPSHSWATPLFTLGQAGMQSEAGWLHSTNVYFLPCGVLFLRGWDKAFTLPALQAPMCSLHAFCSHLAPPLPFLLLPLSPPLQPAFLYWALFLDHYLGCELGHRLQAPQSRLIQHGWCAALEVSSWDAIHLPQGTRTSRANH